MEWKIAQNQLIELLGRTVYRTENVIVEIVANSYDADAGQVKIETSGNSSIIRIYDDGCGMDLSDLEILTTIAESPKKGFIENGETTPKYGRKYLGSFGIGIISFLSLGDKINIFTLKEGGDCLHLEIKREVDENGKTTNIPISEVTNNSDYKLHLINKNDTVSGTTIEIENSKLDFSSNFELIKYKLSNLPLDVNFNVELNNSEIKSEDFPSNCWENKNIEIDVNEIDPTYNSNVSLHLYFDPDRPSETLKPIFKRGIFLKIHGRIIEHNLYQTIRSGLTSPAAIDSRICGIVDADYLYNKIQANREDFFEDKIINKINEKLAPEVQKLINDFLMLKNWTSEEEYLRIYQNNKEQAINRVQNIHTLLSGKNVNFCYKPESEQELVLIIAQLCQLNLLNFKILYISQTAHIDCIVQWPTEQSHRAPDFTGHLEIETSLHKFFTHNHDYRTKPEICCWDIDIAKFEREVVRYKNSRPESIEEVRLVDPIESEKEEYGHQKEVHVRIRAEHDEIITKIMRVYVLTSILSE